MAKKMLIDATHAEETRVVVVDGNKVEEFDFESENKRQLAGNIYLAKVTRVEPSLQAAFVDYGGNRHGFLAFSEIHPDYYQIPVADREALLAEERAYVASLNEDEDEKPAKKTRSRSRSRSKAAAAKSSDAVETREVETEDAAAIPGMDVVDLDTDEDGLEGSSPMELVGETPVETPAADEGEDSPDADIDVDDADDADEEGSKGRTASEKDSDIESVAEEDVTEEIRPPRKPRPRRYKIQEVIKVRQILLVQVVKEERGNKGAALTTYLSLAGRYCVLMPNTARGGGISRKITNAADRKKLKEIANEIDVPDGAGLIIRTAGAKRTKSEIKRDYEYLQRLWEQIRELTLKSVAPAPIYEEGNLIKRSIRDLYNREIDEVIVEGAEGYRTAKDFMKMIMPSHAKNVKQYTDPLPLFARFQVESYLAGMFNPTVQLKSGGYIVIGVTEALVAIDVNSGRATKEGSIEETALKTNLEAAEEVARQLRLRDLAGLIVIDFIDMEERKNNAAVEKRMKDKLKTDRARIQVGRISGFGLMEMSRQRLRPGMIEATTQPCPACHGTGLIRSDDNLALSILRQLEEEGVRRRSREVLLKAPIGIANFIMNQKREHVAQIESRYGLSVRVEADPHLVSPDFTIERFKTATRAVTQVAAPVVSVDTSAIMDEVDKDEEAQAEAEVEIPTEEAAEEQQPKKRRRRRRRRRSKSGENGENVSNENAAENGSENGSDEAAQAEDAAETGDAPEAAASEAAQAEAAESATEEAPKPEEAGETEEKPKRRRTRSRKKKVSEEEAKPEDIPAEAAAPDAAPADTAPIPDAAEAEEAPKEEAAAEPASEEVTAEEAPAEAPEAEQAEAEEADAEAPEAEQAEEAAAEEVVSEEPAEATAPEAAPEAAPEDASEAAEAETADVSEAPEAEEPKPEMAEATEPAAEAEPGKPKRRGWWSVG
ncbi:Ribonuclease E [Pseudoruegeria aquimaris]|uniref:Ribonuclease E n=1 Tax=Pseudoruegeria aquimaris TaxID=393663 RepID=A0A1Y5RRB3_9RHOB|nr:ribonuclease E/G [Pseudoruegeria aquimaris]SLN23270.1 Ribonuclease E [Pseudoruegeria aquimaris]